MRTSRITTFRGLLLVGLLATLSTMALAAADGMPRAKPEEVGLSAERLARIDRVMEEHVKAGKIAGAVTLVARRGKIAHVGAYGLADIEAGKPMAENTIFRIASMTKPLTSTAVMMLYEEGKFLLTDPVGKYLPEFQEMTVIGPQGTGIGQPVAAKNQITIRHLLTHPAGFTYHWNETLGPMYAYYGVPHGLGPTPMTLAEATKALARVPLLFEPGERYEYGLSIDVLGRLVEVVSGMSFDEFLARRLFAPLGMQDTHFWLPPEKTARLAAVYSPKKGGGLEKAPEVVVEDEKVPFTTSYPYKGTSKFLSGGGGLSSTTLDYARFAQMILDKGEWNGARLLSPKTVELMTMDHAGWITDKAPLAFGYGFSVVTTEHGTAELGSIGDHGWGGYWYTKFFIDPREAMVGVFMCQLHPAGGLRLNDLFGVLARQAIVE